MRTPASHNSSLPPPVSFTWNAAGAIIFAVLAIDLSALILPYYFVDDLWLYRAPERGLPDITEVVMFRQGRPVFGALTFLMQELRGRLGIEAIIVARFVAVVSVTAFAIWVHRFMRLWQAPLIALCLSILLVALPSLQIYVTAAPVFAPSLAYCGFVVYVFGRFASREHNARLQWISMLAATTGLVLVWATYQALALVVIGLLTPMLLSERWQSNPRWHRVGAFLFALAASFALYYVLWRVADIGIPSEYRNPPAEVGLHVAKNLTPYRALHVPQIFGFWDTRAHARTYVYACLALVGSAFAIDLRRTDTTRFSRVAGWVFATTSMVAVDLPRFFAAASNTFSYMTPAPSEVATFLLVGIAVTVVLGAIGGMVPIVRRAAALGGVLVCSVALLLAGRNVLVNHVLPNWLEYAMVRSELRKQVAGGSLSAVTIFRRGNLLGDGHHEFSWSNVIASFWVHVAVRDILDELGAEPRIYIEVINADGSASVLPESDKAEAITRPQSGRHVTIDLREVDLRAPSANALRRPPPLPGYESFWSRRREWKRVPDLMRVVPADLTILPLSGINSTLTWSALGAGGENTAIDGDSNTWAADPNGFHQGTFINLSLKSVADVSGVRILSARDYGIEIPGLLRIACDDGGLHEWATLPLRAGVQRVSEGFWDRPCRTRELRLESVGLAAHTSFWIAEIQLFGRLVR